MRTTSQPSRLCRRSTLREGLPREAHARWISRPLPHPPPPTTPYQPAPRMRLPRTQPIPPLRQPSGLAPHTGEDPPERRAPNRPTGPIPLTASGAPQSQVIKGEYHRAAGTVQAACPVTWHPGQGGLAQQTRTQASARARAKRAHKRATCEPGRHGTKPSRGHPTGAAPDHHQR